MKAAERNDTLLRPRILIPVAVPQELVTCFIIWASAGPKLPGGFVSGELNAFAPY
jgi:hypothetical protein